MATRTGSNRTITGYISDLLEYPRWVIEHDVDFTECKYDGHCNAFIDACRHCQFGSACRWLDRHKSSCLDHADVEQLTGALDSAVAYLRTTYPHDVSCGCDTCAWLREARNFRRLQLKSS